MACHTLCKETFTTMSLALCPICRRNAPKIEDADVYGDRSKKG